MNNNKILNKIFNKLNNDSSLFILFILIKKFKSKKQK